MARRISDEQIKLTIIINGNEAQKEILDLEKANFKLRAELKEQEAQLKKLERQKKTDTDEYRKLSLAIKANTTTLNENDAKIKQLTADLSLADKTMGQLRTEATMLQATLRHLVPGTADYKRYEADLAKITARMDELKGKGKDASWSIGSLADKFNRYAALGASVLAAGTGVVLSFQKIIDYNGKLSDSMTDVQKTTGMTKKEVEDLSKSFGILKTRTGRIELLGIAEVGGRLGIAKDEIADFVKVMNKAAVALGDSFEGGPEVVAEKLGRIKGLYAELRDSGVEAAFESVGSALNDLGAAGTASEQNVAEFAQIVGSMPAALKPSIQQALGLGAAFEESGLKAEIAGNNYSKLISIAARDTAAFAKVMQRPQAELEKLINTNPTEFFLQFAQSLKGLDATELSKILDYLKLNDQQVKQVLGAASDNIGLFRDKIVLASDSIADATSLTAEYDLKNQNLAANLERLKKSVSGWFSSDSVVAFLDAAVEKLTIFVGATEDTGGGITALRNTLVFLAKALGVVTVSFISYSAAVKWATLNTTKGWEASKLFLLIQKAQAIQTAISTVATQAWAVVINLVRFRFTEAKKALQALSLTMKVTPWGLVLTLLASVVAAYVIFRDTVSAAAKEQKIFNDISGQVKESIFKEKNALEQSLKVAKDHTKSQIERKKALQDIIDLNPEMLKGLTLQNIATEEGTKILGAYIKALESKARAEALSQKATELNKQLIDIDNADWDEYASRWDMYWNLLKSGGGTLPGQLAQLQAESTIENITAAKKEIQSTLDKILKEQGDMYADTLKEATTLQARFNAAFAEINRLNAAGKINTPEYKSAAADFKHTREEVEAEIEKLTKALETLSKSGKKNSKEYKDTFQEIAELQTLLKLKPAKVINSGDDKAGERAAEKARKLREKSRKEAQDEAKKAAEDNLELERKGIDDRLALMLEGFDKEEALENENHKRKLADLQKQLIDQSEIDKVDANIQDPKADKLTKAYWMHVKEAWIEKNSHINNLIELEEGRHSLALETIYTKAENKRIQDIQADFDRETTLRQAAQKEALAALGNDEIAKQKLQDKFDKEELDRQHAHLTELLKVQEDILADRNSQIEFDLLTDEQQNAIKDKIAELKLKIAELLEAKQSLNNKNGTDDPLAAGRAAFGDADILGFTADQWEKTFSNLDTLSQRLQATSMVVDGLQNIWGLYNNYLKVNEDAQLAKYESGLEVRKRRLKSQLDNGYINQVQYKRGIESLEAETAKKRAEIEYKQAKRDKAKALFEATISTAKGVAAATPNIILMAMAAAAGALQIATIAKTPLPAKGYEKGLYPDYVKREQDGKMFRANYGGRTRSGMVSKPTYFLAGENGPEMVIDNAAYRQMSPETKDMLIRELRGIKGFEKGKYNNDVTGGSRIEVPAASGNISSADALAIIAANNQILQRNTEIMEKIYNEGIIAYMSRDGRELKKFQEEMDRVNNARKKAEN